jgi:lipopolysaccharide transport system ATP-binding protein
MDRARYSGIVAFADMGDFIDQRQTISSGMFVRLAFAVQAYVEPMCYRIEEYLA